MNNNSNNKIVIALLSVLIIAILVVGGYFIIKDLNKDKDDDHDDRPDTSQNTDKDSNKDSQNQNTPSDTTPTTPEEIEAGITFTEVRGNDYYIEAQTNGVIYGTCDISIVPTNGGQGHHDTDDLDPANKVSTCHEDFSLKGMNPGEHKITVIIRSNDGRSKTLEKIVNV